jgi:hypothetical protein
MNAAATGHEEVVRLLLGWDDVKIDIRHNDKLPTAYGWTALTFAAYNGHEVVVRLLIRWDNAGAGRALVHAAGNGHEAVVRLLLEWNDVGLSLHKWRDGTPYGKPQWA